jgi:hypothetical protein
LDIRKTCNFTLLRFNTRLARDLDPLRKMSAATPPNKAAQKMPLMDGRDGDMADIQLSSSRTWVRLTRNDASQARLRQRDSDLLILHTRHWRAARAMILHRACTDRLCRVRSTRGTEGCE